MNNKIIIGFFFYMENGEIQISSLSMRKYASNVKKKKNFDFNIFYIKFLFLFFFCIKLKYVIFNVKKNHER